MIFIKSRSNHNLNNFDIKSKYIKNIDISISIYLTKLEIYFFLQENNNPYNCYGKKFLLYFIFVQINIPIISKKHIKTPTIYITKRKKKKGKKPKAGEKKREEKSKAQAKVVKNQHKE